MSKKTKKKNSVEELLEATLVQKKDEPYELPDNWVWVKFEHSISAVTNRNKQLKQKEYLEEGKYPVVDQGKQTISGFSNNSDLKFSGNLPVIVFGDHTRIVKWIDFDFVQGADGTKILIPKKFFNRKYVYFLLKMVNLPDKGYSRHFKFLKESVLPCPPLREQKRIADLIEQLLNKIEKAKQLVDEAKETFALRRAAILKTAFRGVMTAKWRAENRQGISGAELLNIVSEQRETILSSLPPTKARKNKIKEITSETIPFEIPSSWQWVRLGQISTRIVDGTHHTPTYTETGVPFLSVKDIRDHKLYFDDTKFISQKEHDELIKRCHPEKGDLLITKSGTIGRTAIVDADIEFSIFVSVALIKLSGLSVHPRFIEYMIELLVNENFGGEFVKGSSIKNLHLEELINLPIPLPSLKEQELITRKIDQMFQAHNNSLSVLQNIDENIHATKRAILSKAFKAELGTNIPDEQSSIELITSILQQNSHDDNRHHLI